MIKFLSLLLCLVLSTSSSAESDPDSAVSQLLRDQLDAIASSSYVKFMDHADPSFRKEVTRAQFEVIAQSLSASLAPGYNPDYLGELNQEGSKVHSWRITPSESGDDRLVKMALQEEKVAGFWIQ